MDVSEYYRDPLEFVPEEVFRSAQVLPWTFNEFVHENYLELCTDIHEVAKSSEYLSDADFIDGQLHFPHRNDSRITAYIQSVACRGVAFCNTSKSHQFKKIYKPVAHEVSYKRREMSNLVDKLFVRGGSPTELRTQGVLLSPNRTLHLEVLPLLHIVLKNPKQTSLMSLSQGQKNALGAMNSFSSTTRRSILDMKQQSGGYASEATLLKNFVEKCYSQHAPISHTIPEPDADISLLLQIGGAFNEVLQTDDIEEVD